MSAAEVIPPCFPQSGKSSGRNTFENHFPWLVLKPGLPFSCKDIFVASGKLLLLRKQFFYRDQPLHLDVKTDMSLAYVSDTRLRYSTLYQHRGSTLLVLGEARDKCKYLRIGEDASINTLELQTFG